MYAGLTWNGNEDEWGNDIGNVNRKLDINKVI